MREIAYWADTAPGQSGSPVYVINNTGKRFLIGINVSGNNLENIGVLITNDVIKDFNLWGVSNNQLSLATSRNDCKR